MADYVRNAILRLRKKQATCADLANALQQLTTSFNFAGTMPSCKKEHRDEAARAVRAVQDANVANLDAVTELLVTARDALDRYWGRER